MKKINFTNKKVHYLFVSVVTVLLITVMVLNVFLMYNMAAKQTEEVSSIYMQNIAARLQETLTRAENSLIRIGANLEEVIEEDSSDTKIQSFLADQKRLEAMLSDNSCLNVFCVLRGNVMISDMQPPEHYVIQDRLWYSGLMATERGKVYISPAYQDAFSNNICFTIAKVLSDGETILGIDYNMSKIQSYIEEMPGDRYGDAMIADEDGTIVGYSDSAMLGKKISAELPEYQGVFIRAVTSDKANLFFRTKARGQNSTVFLSRTENGWYLMLSVSNRSLYKESYFQLFYNFITILTLVLIFMALYVFSYRKRLRVEKALKEKEDVLAGFSEKFRSPLKKLAECSDYDILKQREHLKEHVDSLKEAEKALSSAVDQLFSSGFGNLDTEKKEKKEKKREKKKEQGNLTIIQQKRFQFGIISIFVVTMLLTIFFSSLMSFNGSRMKMEEEVQSYSYEVGDWVLEQKSILDMFANVIAAKPELLEDYEGMVEFLDDITKHYPKISATYIANPDFKHGHPMVMNNGWVPEADYREEERVWYTGAIAAEDFNITEPYYDARTGEYCITFSKVVESERGEFYGVFAIDFYLDMLNGILGKSYSETGYAFLVDKEGQVINHPNQDYQFTDGDFVNVHNLCYEKIYDKSGINLLKDYDGRYKACISMKEGFSNFRIIVVKDAWSIYGDLLKYIILFLCLFGICIFAVNVLIYKMVQWQQEANDNLKKAADSAMRAGKAKSQFLAQMSHEIRTPINAVLGMNEMILRESEDEDIVRYSENIQNAGMTLLTLINGILDFSKIEDGKMEIIPVNYDTGTLINALENMVYEKARGKGLEFLLEIDPSLPCQLYGDDIRIRQVITNLLTNAVKYTKEGTVTLKMERKPQEEEETLLLHVEVTDTGMGIREEDMEKLFLSFQRLDEEKNRNIEGTGLGISIVSSLLHMMDSELHVESVYGKGSTFSFDLIQKIVDAEPIGDYHERSRESMQQKRNQKYIYAPEAKILIVDDNHMNLQVALSLLKRNGVRPDTALSGKECLALAEKNHYDIIFLDHMMPEMDGIDTLKALQQKGLAEDTIVIVMTANAILGAKEEYLKEGFRDYISKPIVVEELEKQLEIYLPKEKVSFKENKKTQEEKKEETEETKEDVFTQKELMAFHELAPELDILTGLTYCMESREVYVMMLSEYLSSPLFKELSECYGGKDWENYRIKVHALKSNSMNIGAKALSEKAKELEMAAKGQQYDIILKDHEAMMEAYRALLDGIGKFMEQGN